MPGRSITSTPRPPASSARPRRMAVVVPGKFEVFARTPQRRLKIVVLPVFGLPTSATRAVPAGLAGGADVNAAAVAPMSQALVGDRDDLDFGRHRPREADSGRPNLYDARV